MCGILGIYPPISKQDFIVALDTLTHRGPDDYGIFENKDIMLGHRRLSIIDLSSNGHQPMGYGTLDNNTQQYQIVFNGEIYNYLELKNELISKGYVFHTQSDTEVILASYDCWGEKCLNRFNGMWAFAIWDSQKNQLFLSRDRFGKKPLFYAFVKNPKGQTHFIFASEMKAIYPFLQKISPSKEFNKITSIEQIFSCGQTNETIVANIYRFPKSHYATLTPQDKETSISFVRYYNILDHINPPVKEYHQAVENFREIFFDAVKIRLRSDVPIGFTLSGGVDSSSVVSAACNITHSNNLYAFVACFDGTPQDEKFYAQQVAQYTQIKTSYLDINPLNDWNKLEYYFYMLEELYGRCPIAHIATYHAIKQANIKVTLDGHGSDEMLCGYGDQVEQALWSCGFNINRILDTINIANKLRKNPYTNTQLTKHILISYIKKTIKVLIQKKGMFEVSKDMSHPNFSHLDSFSQMLYNLFYESLLPINIRDYDKYAMINSIEMRMPFMDHRVVEFLFSQPFHYKNRDGFTKKIVRDALSDFMPKNVAYRRSKIGFNAPMMDWIRRSNKQNGLREWFGDVLYSKDFLECDLIPNPHEAINAFETIIHDNHAPSNLAEKIWCKLNPYLWQTSIKKYATHLKDW